jgi:small GTP-binding protein
MGEQSFKIAVLGSGGVGKTCVILRFLRDTFDTDYVPTIQDNFEKNYCFNGKNYKLVLIDTAGQDEMQSITNLAVKSADAYVVMYSCTSQLSFEELDKFREKIVSFSPATGAGAKPKMVFAGNKCDMESDRSVTAKQGRAKAAQFECPFMECSAKANINIAKIFEESLKQLLGVADKKETEKKGQGKEKGKGKKDDCGNESEGGCCNVAENIRLTGQALSEVFLSFLIARKVFLRKHVCLVLRPPRDAHKQRPQNRKN